MEDFVGTKGFVPGIEHRQSECVYDSTNGINDAAGQKPDESSWG